jgi:phospholipid/cholesterol/gamma-HCH transport system substrate-binding protein
VDSEEDTVTRAIKIRLVAFLVLSAVGIVYVAGSYLGIVDRVLGRGFTVHATLPGSGGLFVGSEVTYRGVKIGEVSGMDVVPRGVRVDLALKEGTKVPLASKVFVHNLSAVGEQYLDFEPASKAGPYAGSGDVIHGDAASLPESTDDLIMSMNGLVSSVDRDDLSTAVSELGTMFRGTADPLSRMVDAGTRLVEEAQANQQQTIDLLGTGGTVLTTQQANADNIRGFARDLSAFTAGLKGSDHDLRTVLEGGAPALDEVRSLLEGLEPTLPVFIGNLVTVNQVITARLPAVEQTLVTFPRVIASGFTGTPGDGYGHINLQMNYQVPPCTKGYKPVDEWLPGTYTGDPPTYPAQCLSGPPINQRGSKYAPEPGAVSGTSYRVAPYDARTGQVDENLTLGRHTVFGDHSWQWMLIGPTEQR